MISGFLFAGILAGPYVLDLIHTESLESLRFVDEVSLAVIAFAAGSELYVKELRSRLHAVAWITLGNVVAVPTLGALALFFLSGFIPFMEGVPMSGRVAISILGGAILVARSPSSAIAIVNELRARGPFTQTVLGVTMITDVAVIALFAVSSSAADALITDLPFDVAFLSLLLFEFALELVIGYLLSRLLIFVLSIHANQVLKTLIVLAAGYSVFAFAHWLRATSHAVLPFEIFLEPLLTCMVASFMVTNYSSYRTEFLQLLHDVGPPIYVAFFTLTGASLALDSLSQTWTIALVLFAVRIGAIFIGSFAGGVAAGDPMAHNRMSWMCYVTQAGVGLGLAKEAAGAFPEWGVPFATMIIAVIVLSQLVGPPFFKWAITRVGEAHARAPSIAGEDQVNVCLIFGLESQSLALARVLRAHGWQVRIATRQLRPVTNGRDNGVEIVTIDNLDLPALHKADAEHADAIVMLLSDEENYRLCELAYENFGTERVVVRLHERGDTERFHKLGAIVVEPTTAMVGLLDHFVRSPAVTSLLLGLEEHQTVADIQVRNPDLHGLALRDLRLPLDVLVLSVQRGGGMLLSHGYTRLEVGDTMTIVGSPESLDSVALRFGS